MSMTDGPRMSRTVGFLESITRFEKWRRGELQYEHQVQTLVVAMQKYLEQLKNYFDMLKQYDSLPGTEAERAIAAQAEAGVVAMYNEIVAKSEREQATRNAAVEPFTQSNSAL
jgi:hypothetical protein